MLVITRTQRESIYIYPDDLPEDMTVAELFSEGSIEIVVTDTRRHQCSLGLDAPKGLKIMRSRS